MSKRNNKLVDLGKRLCEYAKSIGCKVEWKTAYPHAFYLAVIIQCNIYSGWESRNYKARSKWRAYIEFASFVINVEPVDPQVLSLVDFELSPICDAFAYVVAASSEEELDLRLSVLGF